MLTIYLLPIQVYPFSDKPLFQSQCKTPQASRLLCYPICQHSKHLIVISLDKYDFFVAWAFIISVTVSRDFRRYICQELHLGLHEQAKAVSRKFLIFAKIFAKNVCLLSRWLRWHGVRVVNYYADTMSAWSMTTLTSCQSCQRLLYSVHGHCVRVVNEYADTVLAW